MATKGANGQAPKPTPSRQEPDESQSTDSTLPVGSEHSQDGSPGHNPGDRSPSDSPDEAPPPLPPRPRALDLGPFQYPCPTGPHSVAPGTPKAQTSSRPHLQSKATTALSITDVHTLSHGNDDQRDSPSARQINFPNLGFLTNCGASDGDADDNASIRSSVPVLETGGDLESMLGDMLPEQGTPFKSLAQGKGLWDENLFPLDPEFEEAFGQEFDELDDITSDGFNQAVVQQWRSKLKHFLILSSAGKPIWSRHGNDQLITSYVGVIQTLISFYQGASDMIKSFSAGEARFVVVSKGFINLVAISKLGESDQQLRGQLEALYMQILSTLTLPVMERMFKNRASIDLRRPLQGTETLLSALADGFSRGSPSTLLSALECLKLRKSHRAIMNNTLLKTRSEHLLYGLIVAGGRLVSVIRPRKHSLHPGDLHLIFNMLFEAGSVRAGEGENWIPLCLPGFNNTGYVYMYVSFVNLSNPGEALKERPPSSSSNSEGEVAILLISVNKESFFELRQMRDDLLVQFAKNGALDLIRSAIARGRPTCTDIVPGTALRHFLYKSRGNVQFVQPSFEPYFGTPLARRQLLTLYTHLHAALHAHPSRPKIYHSTTATHIALAWITPVFELYAIAPAGTQRAALAQAANRLIQYVRREEERVFIIGGAVF
ncbi:DUF254-domain-containing protein [Trichodelitschia bisporula]|uniref:Vacuolar fusion protein MON1 n=1 Tax=Trichodelitschia bisporula TaxID=703511 RepID=A0A6G1HW56_9PEZI|nr:DUF254-domain-containing protein [Trichodelitschia bisporula]